MQLTIKVPDAYFISQQPKDINKQIKLYTALMMYYSNQISAGGACEIAEIDRYKFFEECRKYKIPVLKYDVSEINNEVKEFQAE